MIEVASETVDFRKPLAIDLFCGLGGWAHGFLAEGYDVVGFDIERHQYGNHRYPGQLVLQDALTIHGSQFRNAALIVASPPCTEYSYMAMPWSRGKQIAAALRGQGEFPEGYKGSRTIAELNALFDACFRIQREAIEATRHTRTCPDCDGESNTRGLCRCERCDGRGWISVTKYISMVVENVKGAQPWVGMAKANFGSFYLWGDVESVGGKIVRSHPRFGEVLRAARRTGGKKNPDGTEHPPGSWFKIADSQNRGGRKVPMNFHEHEQTGKPGRSFQSVAVDGLKVASESGRRTDPGKGARFTSRDCGEEKGFAKKWRDSPNGMPMMSSKSPARKAASAQIAKIPFPLAQHIAKVFKPTPGPSPANLDALR